MTEELPNAFIASLLIRFVVAIAIGPMNTLDLGSSLAVRKTTGLNVNNSINQSKPVTPRRRWGTPTDAFAATVAHRRLSSATQSNDDIDWPVYS